MAQLKSFQDLYTAYQNEVKANAPQLTDWTVGSINDVLAGAAATAVAEAVKLIADQFALTFLDTANGPEVTGGSDDLQTLAVDHFGAAFARPLAKPGLAVVTFSRANTSAGDCVIPAGTVVKTPADANGNSQRFSTILAVTMTGTSINASVSAIVAGAAGNVAAGAISTVESTLTDPSVTVTNAGAASGAADTLDDADYRQFIRNQLQQLKGATASAVQAQALTVAGIIRAQAYEFSMSVIQWNPATGAPIGNYFNIPQVNLYVADANGTANGALVASVVSAIGATRAAGVQITVLGATPLPINWTAHIALNPLGPNYATLSTNLQMLIDSMTQYLQSLAIGQSFVVATANAAMLSIWGPSGTGDLTSFSTTTPSGDVTAASNNCVVPGTVGTA